MRRRTIALVGIDGSGKSTLAKLIASRLDTGVLYAGRKSLPWDWKCGFERDESAPSSHCATILRAVHALSLNVLSPLEGLIIRRRIRRMGTDRVILDRHPLDRLGLLFAAEAYIRGRNRSITGYAALIIELFRRILDVFAAVMSRAITFMMPRHAIIHIVAEGPLAAKSKATRNDGNTLSFEAREEATMRAVEVFGRKVSTYQFRHSFEEPLSDTCSRLMALVKQIDSVPDCQLENL